MNQGDFHSFPKIVDNYGGLGKIETITGGDKIVRTKVSIDGGYKGREGVFEYIIEPDGITVNHRFFRAK